MTTMVHRASIEERTKEQSQQHLKAQRDVAELERLARFVITIENDGSIRLTSNCGTESNGRPVITLIAVVAHVPNLDRSMKASVLEIGYRRARPYRRVEHTQTGALLLQRRDESHHLTGPQFQAIYPILLECLETILSETRAGWKSDEPWFINGRYYERGVQITVRHSDIMLCRALLRESLTYFRIAHGPRFIRWLNFKLRYSNYSRYSIRQYGPNVRLAAASFMRSQFSKRPLWTEALLRHVQKRALFESALMDLHGFRSEWDAEAALAFEDTHVPVLNGRGLLVWHTNDQPGITLGGHARHCCRFEMIFDRKNPKSRREQNENNVSRPTAKELDDDPDYVPF